MTVELTGKQKRFLRAQGSVMESVVQIGKGGVTPAVVASTITVLAARELIKVRVLQNSTLEPAQAIKELAAAADSCLVQVIGRNGLLYSPNPENKNSIVLP